MSILFASIIFALSQQAETRVGEMSFQAPPGWRVRVTANYADLTAPEPPKTSRGVFCVAEVKPDWENAPAGGATEWLDKRWASFTRSGSVLEGLPVETLSVPGCQQAAIVSATFEGGRDGPICQVLAAYQTGTRISFIKYLGRDAALFAKHRPLMFAMCKGVRFGSAPPAIQPNEKSERRVTAEMIGADFKMADLDKMPAPAAMPDGTLDEAAAKLAERVVRGGEDGRSALVRAAVASGFTVYDGQDRLALEPQFGKGIGIGTSCFELLGYYELGNRGHRIPLSGLIASLDGILSGLAGAPVDTRRHLMEGLRRASDSQDRSQRFLARFIAELGSAESANIFEEGKDPLLSPLQFYFIIKPIAEVVAFRCRSILRQPLAANFSAFVDHGPAEDVEGWEIPGVVVDGAVATATTIMGELINYLGETLDNLRARNALGIYGKLLGKLNALLAVTKFFLNYLVIESSLEVSDPGLPLVRTKDRTPGEKRTLTLKIWNDSTKILDLMKKIRKWFSFTGLDIDMPPSGPLAGINIEWHLPDNEGMENAMRGAIVRFARMGTPDTRTDGEGTTNVDLEGVPQKQPLSKLAQPVIKKFKVYVVPQLKSPEMKQDILDAGIGAYGIIGPGLKPLIGEVKAIRAKLPGVYSSESADPLGFLTVLLETLSRTRWLGAQGFILSVKDWEYQGWKGDYSIEISGSGEVARPGGKLRWTVSRSASASDVLLIRGSIDPKLAQPGQTYSAFQLGASHKPITKVRDTVYERYQSVACENGDSIWMEDMEEVDGPAAGGLGDFQVHNIGLVINLTNELYSVVLPSDSGYLVGFNVPVNISMSTKAGGKAISASKNGPLAKSFFDKLAQAGAGEQPLGLIAQRPLPPKPKEGPWILEGTQTFKRLIVKRGEVNVTYRWKFEYVAQ